MKGSTNIILILSFLLTSIASNAQKSSIEYKIEKDTVSHGEIYKNDVTVRLAPGDSLLFYEVSLWGFKTPTIEGNTAHVRFSPVFNNSYSIRVMESEYALRLKLKTLHIDTLIRTTTKYYVLPSPAYLQWQGDASLHDAVVFPDTPAQLVGKTSDIKEMVSSTFLKGQRGSVAFSFVIDTNGTTRQLSMRHNTFESITKEKLQQFINKTKWTAAKHNGKIVKTVYGVHIVQ
jgi:hypothetical protein